MTFITMGHPGPSYYKCVATLQDVLFKPILPDGQYVLDYRVESLKASSVKWTNLHGIKNELPEDQDVKYLEGLQPTEWKDQDHYAVLGLAHLRIRATDDDIKRAYRVRCLRHHPDKRMGAGQFIANPEGDYFSCIVKAFEILGVPSKRRSFDSVDHFFDDYLPPKNANAKQFFEAYGYWFAYNARWSTKEPVPFLGNEFTPREELDAFYNFWYEFDSWREYSYLDEEEKEKGQDREERRWIDKQNKAARAKLKKEENARIRTVVDMAYALDPRIKKFRDEDLKKKQEYKNAKKNAYKQKELEESRMRMEAELKATALREQKENEAKEKELQAKKEKEAIKKALKKERKSFRTICKDNNYYAKREDAVISNMAHMEHLCDALQLNELEELNKSLAELSIEESTKVFQREVEKLAQKIANEKVETTKPVVVQNGKGDDGHKEDKNTRPGREWTVDEQKLLEQALKTYGAADPERWTNVAKCLPGRSKKECMGRYKELAALVKAKKAQTMNGKVKG